MSIYLLSRRHRSGPISVLASVLVFSVLAGGCDRKKEIAAPPPVPSVKTIKVKLEDAVQKRSLSGMLIVAEETKLSFLGQGQALSMFRCEKDLNSRLARRLPGLTHRISSGSWRHRNRGSSRRRFECEMPKTCFRRQSTLAKTGTVSTAGLSRAEAAFANARSDLQVAEVAVVTAEENLNRTR